LNQVIKIDQARIKSHLGEMVRETVEETLNVMLDAEAKIGDLIKPLTEHKGYEGLPSLGGRKPTLPEGITHKLSHKCQQLARYPELVEEAKARQKLSKERG